MTYFGMLVRKCKKENINPFEYASEYCPHNLVEGTEQPRYCPFTNDSGVPETHEYYCVMCWFRECK